MYTFCFAAAGKMDLRLSPVFYSQVGALQPQTLKLLPPTKKGTQKVVVGDSTGVLTCFGVKKGDAAVVFKTLPGPRISRVELGGTPGAVTDKVFFAAGTEVQGCQKKGKVFLRFDTNLSEDIQSMCVSGTDLLVCGKNIYNHYKDCKDANYYLCSDQINDIVYLSREKTEELSPVLVCQDGALRLLRGSDLVYEVEVAGPPQCATLNGVDGGEMGEEVLYGTQNGRVGLVQVGPEEPLYRWDLDNEKREGGITCLSTYDILGDGIEDILVGRDDGTVQVYGFDETDEPRLRLTHSFRESITSIAGGLVGSVDHNDIVVGTYNGQILGLTSRTSLQQIASISDETKAKVATLRHEIEELQGQITAARERYKDSITTGTKGKLSAIPMFEINDRFTLNQDEAWYTLAIETQMPLDTVMLQSDVPLDIQEVDKSVAVVSYTPPDAEDRNYVLVTYRCSSTTRLEVKIRTIEGQSGTLQAYVIPAVEPKACRVRRYPIRPLSMHQRIHTFDSARPFNILSIAGNFSLGEAHAWMKSCLPDVPEHIPAEDEATLYFKSVFTATQLECTYRQGSLEFRTDNLSTLTVLKDVLSKEATEENIAVKINYELNPDSVPHMITLVYPLLEQQLMLAKNVQLIDALQELKASEEDISFMPPQWRLILDNSELIQSEFKMQPCMVERIYAMITDLYMDRATFRGENVKSRVSELLETLENCDLDSILAFFEAS